MNWYKKAQQFQQFQQNKDTIEDYYEDTNQEYERILNEYYDRKRKKGQMMSWDVIPFARLKKIWEDYARDGVVRDIKGMDEIIRRILKNISRLQASTDFSGHSEFDTTEWAKEMGIRHPNPRNTDFYFDFLNTQYGAPVSDYGMKKLWDLANLLFQTTSYEQKLLVVDQILNVVHQRGDLAALFIEGGTSSLNQLAGFQ